MGYKKNIKQHNNDIYVFSIVTTDRDHLLFLPRRKSKCWAQNKQSTSSSKAMPDRRLILLQIQRDKHIVEFMKKRLYYSWAFCWIHLREYVNGTSKKINVWWRKSCLIRWLLIRDVSDDIICHKAEKLLGYLFVCIYWNMYLCGGKMLYTVFQIYTFGLASISIYADHWCYMCIYKWVKERLK